MTGTDHQEALPFAVTQPELLVETQLSAHDLCTFFFVC